MHSPTYTIRQALETELPQLPQIEQAAAQLFRATPYAALADDEGMSLANLERYFSEGRIFVAVDEADQPVGFAVARTVDGNAYLHELDVHPAHGRRGLGARLIEAVTSWARQAGYPNVTLSTFVDLPWNAPYYQRLGFRKMRSTELGPGLKAIRAAEALGGLPIKRRVCMSRPVQ